MATEVLLPQWGMNMQEGTLIKWLKEEGDTVEVDEPLVEIETSKINDTLNSPAAGVLRYIMIPQGQTTPVLTVVAIITDPDEEIERPASDSPVQDAGESPVSDDAGDSPAPSSPVPAGTNVQVVPIARRLAQEHNIDLSRVQGTGPSGRIMESDVEREISTGGTPVTADVPLTGMRKTIADRMLQSLQTMAQVTLTTEIDVTAAVELRKHLVGEWRTHRLRPVDQDLVVKAAARSLAEHPKINATLDERGLLESEQINVGVAMALPDGLIVAVVRDADRKDLLTTAIEIRALADQARSGDLEHDDVTGGSFTVTSLSQFDIDGFTPIINPPEVAILGVGRIVDKPIVYEGDITVRSMMVLSITFDHRAVDGVDAAQFLQSVTRYLEDPTWMVS